jgi:hypothetical protein
MSTHHRDERGMSTAEHAVGTLGACSLAVVLYRLGTDGYWLDRLADIVRAALAWRNILDGAPHIGFR